MNGNRASSEIIPTLYLYNEHGKPIKEEAEVTAVDHLEPTGWKMRGWTWSGVKPHLAM